MAAPLTAVVQAKGGAWARLIRRYIVIAAPPPAFSIPLKQRLLIALIPSTHGQAPSLNEIPSPTRCPPNGTVLDPFAGTGITGLAADQLGMNAILIEQSAEYAADARRKIEGGRTLFSKVAAE